MTEIRLADGTLVAFRAADIRRYKGLQLPGAEMEVAEAGDFLIRRFVYEQPHFRMELYHYDIDQANVFTVTDRSLYLRLQTVVRGSIRIKYPDGSETNMVTGECNITREPRYQLSTDPGEVILLYFYLSPGFTAQQPAGAQLVAGTQQFLTPYQAGLIDRLFHNPFADPFRAGYYECCLRELLFLYGATPRPGAGDAMKADAAIYTAANLISTNLHVHYSIGELATHAHTKVATIKQGFQRLYKVGPFAWRLQLKMERAQFLLQSTDEPIQSIANLTGYADAASFVREFKKRVGVTPKLWRSGQRKSGEK